MQAEQQLDDIEIIQDGGPISFEVAGRSFQLRQLTPSEYDRMRAVETRAYHLEMENPEMDDLRRLPVSEDALTMRKLQRAAIEAAIEATEDTDELRDLEKRLAIVKQPDTRNRAEELAEHYAQRTRDRWVWERCLLDGDGGELSAEDRAEVDRYQAVFEEARPYIWRMIGLAVSLPNWSGRKA